MARTRLNTAAAIPPVSHRCKDVDGSAVRKAATNTDIALPECAPCSSRANEVKTVVPKGCDVLRHLTPRRLFHSITRLDEVDGLQRKHGTAHGREVVPDSENLVVAQPDGLSSDERRDA